MMLGPAAITLTRHAFTEAGAKAANAAEPAAPDPRRSVVEIRAEIERLRAEPDRFGFTAIRIATLEWVLSATPEPAK